MNKYIIGKLKNHIYLVEGLKSKDISGQVLITETLNVYKLDANLVTLNETESFKGRFKFTTSIKCYIDRIINDNFYKSKLFKIVVEDLKGILYLSSNEFSAFFTSELNADTEKVSHVLTFTTLSNTPVKPLIENITEELTTLNPCRYLHAKIEKLYIKNKDNPYSEIDFLDCQYTKVYNGLNTKVNIKYTIPNSRGAYYNMLLFKDNRWSAKLTIGNTRNIEYINLFPLYTRLTSEEFGNPDIVTISLSGISKSNLKGFSLPNPSRWIDTGLFICDGLKLYTKLVRQEYYNNKWNDTGEYKKGKLISNNSQTCGYAPDAIYRWVTLPLEDGYICDGISKYYKEVLQISYDLGLSWDNTDITRKGTLYSSDDQDCYLVEWRDSGTTTCSNYNLFGKQDKYISKDGKTWTKTQESKYVLIEEHSSQCGWELKTRWTNTGKFICDGWDSYEDLVLEESEDMGSTWHKAIPELHKKGTVTFYESNCVSKSNPLIYEVQGQDVDLGITMLNSASNLKKIEYADAGWDVTSDMNLIYFILWDVNEEIEQINRHISQTQELGWYSGEITLLQEIKEKIPLHHYTNGGIHIVKIWGIARFLETPNVPFKVTSWGTSKLYPYKKAVYIEDGNLIYGEPTEISGNESINFRGPNVLSLAEDLTDGLKYNKKFNVTYTNLTSAPTMGQKCEEIYMDHNPKLLKTPDLSKAINLKKFDFHNCDSLIELSDCPRFSETIDEQSNKGALFASFALSNCPNIKILPKLLTILYADSMFENSGLQALNISFTVIEGDYMFKNCTRLTDTTGGVANFKRSSHMFEGCINLKSSPKLNPFYTQYGEQTFDYMFLNSGIYDYDSNIFLYNNIASYVGIFEGCKNIKQVIHDIKVNKYSILDDAFKNSGVTTVGPLFSQIKTYSELPSMSQMFRNCDIKVLPNNFFNFGVSEDMTDGYKLFKMFSYNKNLSNYPKTNNIPIWNYLIFLKASASIKLIETFAFEGCPLIANEVLESWGGNVKDILSPKPLILETSEPNFTVYIYNSNYNIIDWGDHNSDKNIVDYKKHFYSENKPHTIKIYSKQGTWDCDGPWVYENDDFTHMLTYKVLDFGSNLFTPHIPEGVDNISGITYLGKNTGTDMETLKRYFNAYKVPYLAEIDKDFFKFKNLFTGGLRFKLANSLRTISRELFKPCTNLTNVSNMFINSSKDIRTGKFSDVGLENVSHIFEGMTNINNVAYIFDGCTNLRDISYTFKGCTGLTGIIDLANPKGEFRSDELRKVRYADSAFEDCANITGVNIERPSWQLESAVGMYRNCTNLKNIDINCYIESRPVKVNTTEYWKGTARLNATECFKNCTSLESCVLFRNLEDIFVVIDKFEMNLTGAFENCTSLKEIPYIVYFYKFEAGKYFSKAEYLWNIPGIIGDHCFRGCTQLPDYDKIPANWK